MQRKATKKTRAASVAETMFIKWIKTQPCVECGDYPVIADHMYGSTFKHNKVLVGMWAILPLCCNCDSVKTFGSHNAYFKAFGRTQAQAWAALITNNDHWIAIIPDDVFFAIIDWNK